MTIAASAAVTLMVAAGCAWFMPRIEKRYRPYEPSDIVSRGAVGSLPERRLWYFVVGLIGGVVGGGGLGASMKVLGEPPLLAIASTAFTAVLFELVMLFVRIKRPPGSGPTS